MPVPPLSAAWLKHTASQAGNGRINKSNAMATWAWD
jgi:hypothetical protein